jgi:hypothetical protein
VQGFGRFDYNCDSLPEVEEHSRRTAQERGDLSYQVSASWLARLERYGSGLTVNKLLALAEIYKTPSIKCYGPFTPKTEIRKNPINYPVRVQPNCRAKAHGKSQQDIHGQPNYVLIYRPM